jgi:hypothetical protein
MHKERMINSFNGQTLALSCRRGKRDQRERLGPVVGRKLNRLLWTQALCCVYVFLYLRVTSSILVLAY